MAGGGLLVDSVGARTSWAIASCIFLGAAALAVALTARMRGGRRRHGGAERPRADQGADGGDRGDAPARAAATGAGRRRARASGRREPRDAVESGHVVAGRGWTQDELVTGVLAGDRRALARSISLVEDGEPEGAEIVRRDLPEHGAGRVRGRHRARPASASRRSSARSSATRAASAGAVGVVSVDPVEPVHAGRPARRPDPARRSLPRSRRLHPLDGHAWPSRRAGRGDAPDAAARRRLREGRRVPRDGRHGAERGRGDRHRGRRPPRADARVGRRRAGAQGGDHGDPRRDRRQQDGPSAGEDDAAGGPVDRRARPGSATDGRRSCSPRRFAARACPSSGTRSRPAGPSWTSGASSMRGATGTSPARSRRSRSHGCGAASGGRCATTARCARSSRASGGARSIR